MTGNRRTRGSGSVYQRQDGSWVGALPLWDDHGKPVYTPAGGRAREYVYGATREEAAEKLKALMAGDPLPANLAELRARDADKFAEGAAWAAVELGAIDRADIPWLTDGDNPYRD